MIAGVLLLAAQVVAGIQVQGNTATPDDEIRRLAAVEIGMPFEETTPAVVAERLRKAKHFDRVEVLRRYASIADPSQIMLVIIVDEGPVKIVMTGDPEHPTRVVRKRWPNLLVLPIVRREDGYAPTFGARLGLPDKFGKQSRISFPLMWGGTKSGGIDVEKRLSEGFFDRITASATVSRRRNLTYDVDDDRASVTLRAERELKRQLRFGVIGGWQHVSFKGVADRFAQIGADVRYDTRVDPILPRDAVFLRAGVDQFAFGNAPTEISDDPKQYTGYRGSLTKTDLDARGYIGVPLTQSVLALRGYRVDANRPMPPYMQPEIGGLSTLRGFPAGYAAGDTMVTMSAEVIVPLNSPLKVGRFGVTAFTDRGAVYDKGESLSDQTMLVGYGGSVWFAATLFRLNVAVAHGRGEGTRAHVGGTVTF